MSTLAIVGIGLLLVILGGMATYIIKLVRNSQSLSDRLNQLEEDNETAKDIINNIVYDVPSARRVWQKLRDKYKSKANHPFS